jgi:hypothetical protein
MERFGQKQMRLDKLTQLGWEDAADNIPISDMKYAMTELKDPALVKPQTDTTAASPSLTTFGVLMQALYIVPG